MNRITVLDDGMIDKIAAGEVVERPGSVVKELVENSIDSGATQITIEIKDGGISLIKVTDNGSGIPEADLGTAFIRHATSKISDINDLENVLTLGFRGEALSSIAAVSQIEMISKPKSQNMAKRIEVHGGKLVGEGTIGSTDGTIIIMRNLFFNVPARRKFLKKPSIESGHVSDIVNKIILGHPEIAFNYIVNDTQIIHTNGSGDLKNTIFAIYGREVAKSVIMINENSQGLEISGHIGKPEISRGNRSYGSIFINGRYVKSKIIEQAVEDAYKNKIMTGKFPVYILNLNLAPNLVDVNVHPQKTEVRFSDENLIFTAFNNATIKALKNTILIPEITISKEIDKTDTPNKTDNKAEAKVIHSDKFDNKKLDDKKEDKPLTDAAAPRPIGYKKTKSPYVVNVENIMSSLFKEKAITNNSENAYAVLNEALTSNLYSEESLSLIDEKSENDSKSFFRDYRITGQILSTYWIIEQGISVYIIDQHAAHERIIFEKLMKGYKSKKTISQSVLEPLFINLSEKESAILDENLKLFKSFGYTIEPFGRGEYALTTIPFVLGRTVKAIFFMDILDKIIENPGSVTNIYDEKVDTIAMISCKAAVKANDRLNRDEAKKLIEELLALDDPFTCPHGRPTIIMLAKHEIEKMFKRIL